MPAMAFVLIGVLVGRLVTEAAVSAILPEPTDAALGEAVVTEPPRTGASTTTPLASAGVGSPSAF
jgi:hypothetical protein